VLHSNGSSRLQLPYKASLPPETERGRDGRRHIEAKRDGVVSLVGICTGRSAGFADAIVQAVDFPCAC